MRHDGAIFLNQGNPWSRLQGELVRLQGANIVGLYFGIDIQTTAGVPTSWPARIGPNAAKVGTGNLVLTTMGSAPAAANLALQTVALQTAAITYADVWCVSTGFTADAADQYETAIGSGGTGVLARAAGTQNFYRNTHVDGGVATLVMPSVGNHIYEVEYVSAAAVALLLNWSGVTRGWRGPVPFVMMLAATPSAAERPPLVTALKQSGLFAL